MAALGGRSNGPERFRGRRETFEPVSYESGTGSRG